MITCYMTYKTSLLRGPATFTTWRPWPLAKEVFQVKVFLVQLSDGAGYFLGIAKAWADAVSVTWLIR